MCNQPARNRSNQFVILALMICSLIIALVLLLASNVEARPTAPTFTVNSIADVIAGGDLTNGVCEPATGNGNEYAFNGEYREMMPPERLVSTFEFEGVPGHIVVNTATFEELSDRKTNLTITSLFASVEDRDGMLNSGMESGANETWDRLAELLAKD